MINKVTSDQQFENLKDFEKSSGTVMRKMPEPESRETVMIKGGRYEYQS